jgi:uncharacterized protein YuzB (UPF0349 family)
MRKITLGLISLFFAVSSHAQYVDFDSTIDPQQGDIAVADIDNDGDMDVIFYGTDIVNGIVTMKGAIMLNNGDGTFTQQSSPSPITPGRFAKIKFGDIDGDGDLDVLFVGVGASNVTNSVGIALNDGSGHYTLADPSHYGIDQTSSISCGFADFDNNGLLDFYIFGNGVDNCAIYFQEPNGSFTKKISSFSEYNFTDPEVSVVDFNNDGYPDIFVNAWLNNPQGTDVEGRFSTTFVNDQFGNFTRYAQPNIIQKGYGSASWGDFNGDGWLDLVLQGDGWVNSGENSDGIVRVYKNANGTLLPQTTFSFFRQLNTGGGNVVADWNNDGLLDIIVGGWNDTKGRQATSLYTCSNGSTFSFSESSLSDTYFPGVSEHTYEVADLNNDGKIDLLMMGFNGNQTNQVGKYQKNICGYCPSSGVTSSYSKPSAPTSLTANVDNANSMVTLSWTAPSSESGKMGTTYNVSLKNTLTGKWLYNPMAVVGGTNDGKRKVTGLGNVFANKKLELYDLPNGTYEWTVQAINGAYFGGSFATTKTFTIATSGINEVSNFNPTVYGSYGNLHVEADNVSVNVYNVSGVKIIKTKTVSNFITKLPAGIYIVEVANSDSKTYKTKVVIK